MLICFSTIEIGGVDLIKAENLIKRYGSINAIDHFSIQVDRGEMAGLFGPGSSGKTTIIQVLQALIPKTKGEIEIMGKPMTSISYEIKRKIGYVPEEICLFQELNVYENIDYFCSLYIREKKKREELVEETIKTMGIFDFWKFYPYQLNQGLLRKVNMACGIAHRPEILFLDAPMEGVDIQSSKALIDRIIHFHQEGMTIIYATHNAEEVEALSGKIYMMDRGKCLASGTKEELKEMIGIQEKISIEAYHISEQVLTELKGLPHVCDVTYHGDQLILKSQNGTHNLLNILNFLQENEVSMGSVYSERPTLNDVFLEITGKEYEKREDI